MLLSNDPIVITKDDVDIDSPVYFESNCACPADGFTLAGHETLVSSTIPYVLPPLRIDAAAPGFHLAFNPLGAAGVSVLNDAAFQLLQTFQQPYTLADGVRAAGAPAHGLQIVQRFVQLGLLDPLDAPRTPRQSPPQTLTAWLHVTNECNLRCPYCYVHKSPDTMELARGYQAVDAVFRSALANGFRNVKFKYAGGEATLNLHTVLLLHDYAQRLATAHRLTLEGVVLSNGVALTHRMIAQLQARQIRLMISLDGVGAPHDAQRPFVNGHGSFAHVERALDRLAAHQFIPSISITISNRNLAGLPEVVEYVLKRGLPFKLNFYRENDCSATIADLTYQDEQVIDSMRRAFAVIASNLPRASLLEALVDLARLDSAHDRTCGVGQSYMVINQRGGLAKCHMELERTVGDVSAADPLQLIREDQIGVQNLRVEEKEGCWACEWRYWCAGGCPLLTYRVTGRFDVKSPNCRIYKALFPEVLRLEALRLLKYSELLSA
jgi:uncharacterized protein